MKTVLKYLIPHIPVMAIGFVIKFTGTIMDLLLPWVLSYIIDNVVPLKDMRLVYIWGAVMVLCAFIGISFNVIANRISIRVSRQATKKIRNDMFRKISYMSVRQTDKFTMASLVSRVTSDTYNVHQMIDRMQRLGVRAPILVTGGILVTYSLEPVLTGVLASTIPLLLIVVYTASKFGIPLYTKAQQALDKMVCKISEDMAGIRVIKALSKTEYEKKRFDGVNNEIIRYDKKAGIIMGTTNPVMNLLLNLGMTGVIIAGAYRVNSGASQPGIIIAFLSYFAIILNALLMITRIFVICSKGIASAKRVEEVLLCGEEMQTVKTEREQTDSHIEFKDVTFSYNGVKNNLEDISFSINKGETLGIIGATGSGKTTIANLLLRFYDCDKGGIFINGENVRSIEPDRLYKRFGAVFQNDFLMADTIRENVTFGRSVSDDDFRRAAELAQAEFIKEKEGADSFGLAIKGSNLSGGQKQRLLIARALAAKPEILILDDCSSALDYRTDANLRKAVYSSLPDTTKIIIAQRVSSVMNADKIIVIEDGRISGMGTHSQLLESCEAYREIYDIQMGGADYGALLKA